MGMRKLPLTALVAAFIIGISSYANAQGTYFFLHDENIPGRNAEVMDTSQPTKSIDSTWDLNDGDARWYTSPFDEEQHINGDVEISIFIEAFFPRLDILPLQFRIIRVYVLDVSPSWSENEIASSRAIPLFFFSNDTIKEKEITLNIDHVIPAGHRLGIRIEKSFDILSLFPFTLLSPFFSTNIVYDSIFHKSYVYVPFNVTGGGIEIESYPQKREVKAGEEISYTVVIYNNGAQDDTISLSYTIKERRGENEWEVTLEPSQLIVEGNYLNYSYVTIKAPQTAQPGDFLNITLTAQGATGTDSIWLNTSLAEPTYGVDVTGGENKDGVPGDSIIYTFTVRNVGDLPDTYDISVTCDWVATPEKNKVSLQAGEKEEINVEVEIPLDAENGTQVSLVFTARSQNSSKEDSARVTTTVSFAVGGEKESIWNKLLYPLFILGVIALLVIAFFLTTFTKKFVILSCDERMKEIPPGYSAHYKLKIKNALEKIKGGKNKITYKLSVGGEIPEKWKTEFEKDIITLDGGEEEEVEFTVETSPDSSLEDWASIDIIVTPVKKTAKSEKINIVTLLREPKPHLEIEKVEHEPETFVEGEKVISKVKIVNKGEAPAEEATIILSVNGKEKNRVEGLNIPVNAHVEVEIPWYAEEGENRISIKIS